jgi:hypothetical protein
MIDDYREPDYEAFPVLEEFKPGLVYVWVPAAILPEYKEQGYDVHNTECTNNGLLYFLTSKGKELTDVHFSQTAPDIRVWVPDEPIAEKPEKQPPKGKKTKNGLNEFGVVAEGG